MNQNLIAWILFYDVSVIFQPYNDGEKTCNKQKNQIFEVAYGTCIYFTSETGF